MTFCINAVSNKNDLLLALRNTDITVPPRIEGRTTSDTEIYSICHLLSALAFADKLTFPFSVCQQDRPDALICLGNTEIGVEITEAIPTQFAHLCAVAQKRYPGHWVPTVHALWDEPNFTVAGMQALLEKSTPASSGWVADEPGREWANFILKCVDAKLDKLAKPDFGKHDQNWLAIYDNLPLPHVNLAHAVAILRPLLTDRWLCHPAFDALFVEHNLTIAKITATASAHFAVNNLWSVP